MSERKSPRVRFSGFCDAWEQRKLGDICKDFQYGLNASATQFDGINKYLRITDIDDDTHLFLMDDLSSPLADLNSLNEFLMHEGEIVFARTGASVGKTYIYKEIDGKVYFAGFLIRAKVKQNYDADFVFQNTLTENYKKFVVITSQRSGQPGINAKEYGTFEFMVPQLEEQKKISRTLCSIDTLITLHQRKLVLLKLLKQSMLQKMFPGTNEVVPSLRFKGFTDDWEQRKLGDFSAKVTSKNVNHIITETLTNSAEEGIISQTDYFDRQISNDDNIDGYYVVEPDDFVYNPRTSTKAPVGPINRNRLGRKGIMSPLYTIFRSDETVDRLFLEYYFKTTCWHPFMKYNGDSGARSDRFSIKNELFFSMGLCLSSLEEQERIGKFLDQISSLITLHQRNTEALKIFKAWCLQNMFV